MAEETKDEVVEVEEAVKITRYAGKNEAFCVRCKPGRTPAEWNFKALGEKNQLMCDTHARWWAAEHGMMTFPGDE